MKLAIVVPCYNEEEVLPKSAAALIVLLEKLRETKKIDSNSRIYFVDDGSTDGTWARIGSLVQSDNHIGGIKLSRNQGHQQALLAGLFTVDSDAVVSIDADLQDDVAVIEEMVSEFHNGVDIVYAARRRRDSDTMFKMATAKAFYRIMRYLGVNLVHDHADFRLMSRKAVEALKGFSERNLFLRGIVPLIGFPSSIVYYDRAHRAGGVSKYSLRKMIGFAVEGITSFSVGPLRLISFIGLLVFALSMMMSAYVVWIRLFSGHAVPGWASTVLPVYFLSGIQILCIGIIGEYIGKIYKETKARPRYIIEKTLNL